MVNGKIKDIGIFGGSVLTVLVIGYMLSSFFFRWDLTSDKRYSISDNSIEILNEIEDDMTITFYLDGNMPLVYKNLNVALRETMQEFYTYTGSDLNYSFQSPYDIENKKTRTELIKKLQSRGIPPITYSTEENGKTINKLLFPGAIVEYQGKEMGINFLNGSFVANDANKINEAIEQAEFEIVQAIKTITQKRRKTIGFITGHNEASPLNLQDLAQGLSQMYTIMMVDLPKTIALDSLDAIIVAQPKSEFSEADKYKIDQFILHGGKAMFFLDVLEIKKDTNGIVGLPYDLNISDLLFKYGLRINQNILQDYTCQKIPIREGQKYELKSMDFYPLINQFGKHPITENLSVIKAKNIGTFDTTKAPGIKKTALLYSSNFAKVMAQPIIFSPEDLRFDKPKSYYPTGNLPLGYLLEGKFKSLYKNRPIPKETKKGDFLGEADSCQVLVISDGDMILNDLIPESNNPLPLGYDQVSKRTYDNKAFVLNAVSYLLSDSGLINLKRKTLELRSLDNFKVKDEKLFWQLLNVGMPILAIILFAIGRAFVRKRKYGRF